MPFAFAAAQFADGDVIPNRCSRRRWFRGVASMPVTKDGMSFSNEASGIEPQRGTETAEMSGSFYGDSRPSLVATEGVGRSVVTGALQSRVAAPWESLG